MTYAESIPIAKQLAENSLRKGFDVEAFLVLSAINQFDIIPESNVDEQITDIGKIFVEYYYSKNDESLQKLLNSFIQTMSEIYHTINNENQKILFKHEIQRLMDII